MENKSAREIEQGLEFGFTDDKGRYDAASAFRDAALADGWEHKTDGNPASKGVVHLTKDGFVMHVMTRDNYDFPRGPGEGKEPHWHYQAEVSIWGPDRLAIRPPDVYDWNKIQAGVRTCNECGAIDVDTERYFFAGRACAKCLPGLKAKHERGNWTA